MLIYYFHNVFSQLGMKKWLLCSCSKGNSIEDVFRSRPVEMEKIILGGGVRGARNCEILSATMVGQRRKFFISNRLKVLEKLYIYLQKTGNVN